MNKRIRKKRAKLGDYHIGDHVYNRKDIVMINKANIGRMYVRYLYYTIKEPKLTRPRVKSLINHIYKNRMKHAYLSFKHLRFARHLNEPNSNTKTIPGGKKMKYASSAFVSMTQPTHISYEDVSTEVDE